MNVTVGAFLPDVELVNLTIEGVAVAVPEAVQHGYIIHRTRYANGSKAYVIEVPLDAPSVKKEVCAKTLQLPLHGMEMMISLGDFSCLNMIFLVHERGHESIHPECHTHIHHLSIKRDLCRPSNCAVSCERCR